MTLNIIWLSSLGYETVTKSIISLTVSVKLNLSVYKGF